MVQCKKDAIQKIELENTSWIYEIESVTKNKKMITEFYFHENGLAYEKSSILRYEWKYSSMRNILTLNNQTFKILQANPNHNKLYLINENTKIKATLTKVKE